MCDPAGPQEDENITPQALQCSPQASDQDLARLLYPAAAETASKEVAVEEVEEEATAAVTGSSKMAAAAQLSRVLKRRTFLRSLGAAALAFITFPASWVQAKKIGIELKKATELQQPGGTKLVRYRGLEILVVRDKNSGVHAINNTCTHKKCKVKYRTDTDGLFCKCHKSAFALDGKVLAGPAPRPLTTYSAVIKQGRVIIDLP
jgi:Rieske Fe-S protein